MCVIKFSSLQKCFRVYYAHLYVTSCGGYQVRCARIGKERSAGPSYAFVQVFGIAQGSIIYSQIPRVRVTVFKVLVFFRSYAFCSSSGIRVLLFTYYSSSAAETILFVHVCCSSSDAGVLLLIHTVSQKVELFYSLITVFWTLEFCCSYACVYRLGVSD